jgi:hypothetical protein
MIERLRHDHGALREAAPLEWTRSTVELTSASYSDPRCGSAPKAWRKPSWIAGRRWKCHSKGRGTRPLGKCQSLLAIALCNRTVGVLDDNLDEANFRPRDRAGIEQGNEWGVS